MRPDAIPIVPVRTYAALTGEVICALFGEGYRLRGTERVEVLQRGKQVAMADVFLGEVNAMFLDAADRSSLARAQLRLRGPKGALPAPTLQPIANELVLPPGLMAAWNLSTGQRTTVALGDMAVRAAVAAGGAVCLRIDRALAFSGGLDSNALARWVPDVVWPDADDATAELSEQPTTAKRVITENDVRRARMLRKRIRLQPGQIITPAARDLAEELGVFSED